MTREAVIAFLADEPSSTSRDVAEAFGCSLPTASSRLRKLAARGVLVRECVTTPTGPVYCYRVDAGWAVR